MFQRISGIALTATQVWILGRRNATTNVYAIDRFSLTGVRDDANSDILVRGINDATGLNIDSTGSQAWVGSFAGDYIAGLIPSSDTGQRRKLSYDVAFATDLINPTYDIEVKDRILYSVGGTNLIKRKSLSSSADLSDWTGPSGKLFWGIAKAGKFIYVKTATELYRLDTTQATPTFVRVTGAMSTNQDAMTIVNNRLYVKDDEASIKYLTLTGSVNAGYTAVATTFIIQSIGTGHGLTGAIQGIASYSTFIYQSTTSASGTQPIIYGWDYTAGSGDFVGQANDIGGTVNIEIAVDTDGTLYAFNHNRRRNLYGFYPTGARTANVMNIDRTHSFPLGTRQGDNYGFGYDQTNDRFLVPNLNRVNTYDKTVVSAARSYQRFGLIGIPGDPAFNPVSLLVKNDRAYLVGGRGNNFQTVKIYSWPGLRFIETRNVSNSQLINTGIILDGRAFISSNSPPHNRLREISLSSFALTTTEIVLGSTVDGYYVDVIYEEDGTLYVKTDESAVVRAYSAAGTGTKTSITGKEITILGSNHSEYNAMFGDADYFYFCRNVRSQLACDAYSKTTRLRDANGDFVIDSITPPPDMSAVVYDSIVFLPMGSLGVSALVKAV